MHTQQSHKCQRLVVAGVSRHVYYKGHTTTYVRTRVKMRRLAEDNRKEEKNHRRK